MKERVCFMVWGIVGMLLGLEMGEGGGGGSELEKRVENVGEMSEIKGMESDGYGEKYVLLINEVLDGDEGEGGI